MQVVSPQRKKEKQQQVSMKTGEEEKAEDGSSEMKMDWEDQTMVDGRPLAW